MSTLEEELEYMSYLGNLIKKDGFKKGAEFQQLENLKILMKNLNFTFDQAADAFGLSENEKAKYSAKL
jgi:hypothetical protein